MYESLVDCIHVTKVPSPNSPTNVPLPVVLGILCITDNKLQNNEDPNEPTFLLIVTELIVCEKRDADKFLPYELLRYCIDPKGGQHLGDLCIV
jgi:hypothetical protein